MLTQRHKDTKVLYRLFMIYLRKNEYIDIIDCWIFHYFIIVSSCPCEEY
jgi:hypothetical protein